MIDLSKIAGFADLSEQDKAEAQQHLLRLAELNRTDRPQSPEALQIISKLSGLFQLGARQCWEGNAGPADQYEFTRGGKRYLTCRHEDPHTYLIQDLNTP